MEGIGIKWGHYTFNVQEIFSKTKKNSAKIKNRKNKGLCKKESNHRTLVGCEKTHTNFLH